MIEFSAVSATLAVVRFGTTVKMTDVQGFVAQVRTHLSATKEPAVYAVDARAVDVFAPDIAEALINLMKSDNPKILRTAIWIRPRALFSLQVERMLREANNPARRTFSDDEAMFDWLGEVLGDADCELVRSALTSQDSDDPPA